MRESVERRRKAEQRVQQQRREVRRLVVYGALVGLALAWSVLLSHINQSSLARQAEREQAMAAQAKEDEKLIAKIIERRKQREQAEREVVAAEITRQIVAGGSVTVPENPRCNHAKTHIDPKKIDVLVNKQQCLQPMDYKPELVQTYDALLHPAAADSYRELLRAAMAAGFSPRTTSSYRSFDTQTATYRHWLTQAGGDTTETGRFSALPGYSEHQTGLAVDVANGGCVLHCFTADPMYAWMRQNAANYGFIERYPADKESVTGFAHESWHYRYVGKDIARDMQAKKITTLEEYWEVGS